MCGIVAAIATENVAPTLLAGLKALEYRGYDSAGIALLTQTGLQRLRALGKVHELEALHAKTPIMGNAGIGHTRWATHGVPASRNAHPLASGDSVAVVHNGIIENHAELRAELNNLGYNFTSETDTEVIAHLIEHALRSGISLLHAVQNTVDRLHGAFAIAVASTQDLNVIIGARRGSPLVVGLTDQAQYIASDIQALIPITRHFIYLAEGDTVEIRLNEVRIFDQHRRAVHRPTQQSLLSVDAVQRGEYRHYMLKEIHEQPAAISDTLEGRIVNKRILTEIFGVDASVFLTQTKAVHIVACGSSYHAACVAKYWIEDLARIPVNVEIASEYRYRNPVVTEDTLLVTVSQSGETADTLAALRLAKKLGYLAELAICNVPESSLIRESQLMLMTRAGPEIGVASTKAFTTQLVALALLALELGRCHGLDSIRYTDAVHQLGTLPGIVHDILTLDGPIQQLAERYADKQHVLFLGRGTHFPIAMEGALKLKEISYIHAEAYAAGELKHGPLALIDRDMPVIAVAPNNHLLEKLRSNLEEVRARGGQLLILADQSVSQSMIAEGDSLIALPTVDAWIAPIVYTIPLQLLAYHVAVLKGTDVDQPRNLAKSVTVE